MASCNCHSDVLKTLRNQRVQLIPFAGAVIVAFFCSLSPPLAARAFYPGQKCYTLLLVSQPAGVLDDRLAVRGGVFYVWNFREGAA